MTTHDDDLERQLGPWFRQVAPEREPAGLLEAVLTRTEGTKRRSRWLVADTWRPDVALPRPVVVSRRLVWVTTTALLVVTLAVGLVAVGSSRHLPPPFGPARAGLLAFDRNGDIFTAASDGTGRTNLTPGPALESSPSWSPDGTKIAYWSRADIGLPASLWVMDADGSQPHAVTGDRDVGGSENFQAAWSPDSKQLAFAVGDYYSGAHLWVVGADGSDLHEVSEPSLAGADPAWSPDGRLIAFRGQSAGTMPDGFPPDQEIGIWVVAPDGTGARMISVAAGGGGMPNNSSFGGPVASTAPSWSPDGKTLAYATGANGHHRIAIGRVDGSGETFVPLPDGDYLMPVFSPDGTRIAFVRPINPALYAADAFVVGVDGTDLQPLPTSGMVQESPPSWAPDGTTVLLMSTLSRSILLYDVSGQVRAAGSISLGDPIPVTGAATGSNQRVSWQRLAP